MSDARLCCPTMEDNLTFGCEHRAIMMDTRWGTFRLVVPLGIEAPMIKYCPWCGQQLDRHPGTVLRTTSTPETMST